MGTPAAAVPTLQRCLADGHEIVAVWTQPDRPSGRGNKITASPVKEFALANNLVVHQPQKIKTEEARALFASHAADLGVVVAYGRILPIEFLNAPRLGCINVHFSLLPKYRGAAPVNWAIVRGEATTGVTTMFIAEQLDAGPILLQRETAIGSSETATELMSRLAPMGAELLGETLAGLDQIKPMPQNEGEATFAPVLKREDGLIDWTSDAQAIERAVRGFQPWPNAHTLYRGERLIVWEADVGLDASDHMGVPGEVLEAHKDKLVIGCGAGSQLFLSEVQLQGKRRMSARDFINGSNIAVTDRLG